MAFEDYLSEQAKKKANYSTPMQDIARAAQIREEIFGIGRSIPMPTAKDWKRLDEAEEKARVAKNFFNDGVLDKTGR